MSRTYRRTKTQRAVAKRKEEAGKNKRTWQESRERYNEKHEWDNRSNRLNPNHDAYYQSRGWEDKEEYDDYYYDDDDDY